MSRTLMLLTWAAVTSALVAAVHYYLWMRLLRDPELPALWRRGGTALLIIMAASMPLAMVLGQFVRTEAAKPLVWAGLVWMGLMFYLLVVVAGGDAVRITLSLYQRLVWEGGADPSRRVFFARALSGGAAVAAVGLGGVGLLGALRVAQVKRVRVELKRLPASMNGFRIVQISDLHVGPTIGRDMVEALVEKTNALQPHLVVLTGDLMDGSVQELGHAMSALANIKSRYGIYACTGNHEYYSGAEEWIRFLASHGIKTLRNERVTIGDGDDVFELAGVDDASAHRMLPDHGCDVEGACRGAPPNRELILLAHQPNAIYEAARCGVSLQLSGHTHGGQIWPFGYLVSLTQPYMRGLNRHNENTQIYVSCGTGYWGPPMRLGAPQELTCLELYRAEV